MSFQAYLDAVEDKTGKTPRALLEEAVRRQFAVRVACSTGSFRQVTVIRVRRSSRRVSRVVRLCPASIRSPLGAAPSSVSTV